MDNNEIIEAVEQIDNAEKVVKRDWLMYIAIIIMLVGVGLVLNESRICKNPYDNMIQKFLDGKGINYTYVKLEVYQNNSDVLPIISLDLIGQGKIVRNYTYNPIGEINLSAILVK